jgi:hypothetical protein
MPLHLHGQTKKSLACPRRREFLAHKRVQDMNAPEKQRHLRKQIGKLGAA